MFFKSPTLNRRPSSNGFTLLEVMIALAIIGATLTVSLYTVNFHAEVSYENGLKTRMLLLAKEKLRTIEIDLEESSGPIEGTDFTYESSVSESAFDEIIKLQAVVRGYDKEFTMSKLVLKKAGTASWSLQTE